MKSVPTDYVQLEIRAEVFRALIGSGVLFAEDIHALNEHSRENIRALLLGTLMTS